MAGTGEQYMVGGADNVLPDVLGPDADRSGARLPGPPTWLNLSSPWDVAWSAELAAFVVAMAGNHTLWAFDDRGRARCAWSPAR